MRKSLLITTTISIIFTGCISSFQQSNLNASEEETKALRFSTNESTFITKLKPNISKEGRNEFIEEFILKSDVQCQQYLDNPKKDDKKSESEDELYMNIAQTVSTVLGLGYITQTAQAIFLDDSDDESSKEAYENALSPEIKKGVEIVRERYAKKIKKKKELTVKKYNSNQLKEDMNIYDKQCNMEYGLIEINRALKEMQSQMRNPVYAKPTPKINLESVKEKVKNVSKKVKQQENNTTKKIEQKDTNLTK